MRKMNFFLIESSIMAVFYMHTWKRNVIWLTGKDRE